MITDHRRFIIELLTRDTVVAEIQKEMEHLLLIIPEIGHMVNFEHQHPHHHLNVWDHTLLALSYSPNRLKTRLSLLLHDIGKPFCYQQDGNIKHYKGHAEQSAKIAESVLDRLGFDREFTKEITEIILRHDTPLSETDITSSPTLSAEIFEAQKCDALAHNPEHNSKRLVYIDKTEAIFQALANRDARHQEVIRD